MTATAYPLTWPQNMPRTKGRVSSRFKTGLNAAIKNVRGALTLFANDSGKAVKDIVISSNVSLGVDKPSDPGVAVWFTWDGLSVCIAVDRYPKVEDNLQAIYMIIDARRTELRHGGLNIVRATFTGFAALPAPARKSWQEVLRLTNVPGHNIDREMVEQAFRELAKGAHPDRGGSETAMAELNIARDEALKEL
ncbi:J domain-containing protein [Shinella zoogloeoides]|uniref:J domain-containing protein n=1 Tax=Shinella zoogloeoides TaxID=352475 RepID=UPI00299D3344|nr:J domain-containing protein [Shinella zoogloeoides]WPE19851.1 hypothetical protein ShzoTeo12_10270 [Shinella zoogloeoides]